MLGSKSLNTRSAPQRGCRYGTYANDSLNGTRMAMDPNATRYEIELDMLERRPELSDSAAIALLRSEFQRALNASYFWRMCSDDFRVTVVSRVPVDTRRRLPTA